MDETRLGQTEADNKFAPFKGLEYQQGIVGLRKYYAQWISQCSYKVQPLYSNLAFLPQDKITAPCRPSRADLSLSVASTVYHNPPFIFDTKASDAATDAVFTQKFRPIT